MIANNCHDLKKCGSYVSKFNAELKTLIPHCFVPQSFIPHSIVPLKAH